MDAVDQAALVAKGEVTPLELLDAAIERIEQIDPALNAVVIRWFEHARDTARSDLPNGAFRGVPVEWTDSGLPVGVQLVAAYGREDVLIRVASQLETGKPWAYRTPAV